MARQLISVLTLLMAVGLGAVYVIDSDQYAGKVNRTIQVKGVFLLVNEQGMLSRLQMLSSENVNREDFLVHVRKMLDNEPYVLSSSVRYSWPDEVVIEISEVTPVATVNRQKLLLENCRTVDVDPERLHGRVVAFNTPGGEMNESLCQRIVKVLPILKSVSARNITMMANGDYILKVDGSRLVVSKNDIMDSTDKVRHMVNLIRTNRINANYIDMRYASGAAIGRVSES